MIHLDEKVFQNLLQSSRSQKSMRKCKNDHRAIIKQTNCLQKKKFIYIYNFFSISIFYSLFFSLRTALYGEQQKEVMTLKKKARKGKKGQKKLGILEKVQEVGPERFLSPAPLEEESEVEDCEVQPLNQDWDELIDIKPGTLTVSRGMRATRHESDLFGELKVKTKDLPLYILHC